MAQTAPFHNAMKLGAGWNSYTQELRLDGAVEIIPKRADTSQSGIPSSSTSGALPPEAEASRAPNGLNEVPASAAQAVSPPSTAEAELAQVGLTEDRSLLKTSNHGDMVTKNNASIRSQMTSDGTEQLFSIPPGPVINSNQSVTFSTRAISNVSDIMDALNISASTSIRYGTIHGNGSAAFVNEDKVLDSQLNYLVSVRVNNNMNATQASEEHEMTFKPIKNIIPEKFTEVYGDCFIAGFQEGGEFNAIISIDCHDKSKLDRVKQEIDLQLAVPPVPPLNIGFKQNFDKGSSELFQGIEMTISVNWTGGGEVKPPGTRWTLQAVIAAANAYPSMVARDAAVISAILKPYTSLQSFVEWQYAQHEAFMDKSVTLEDSKAKQYKIDQANLWIDKALILNYAPCTLYTNDLFDAYMSYKKLWKRISYIMSDPKKWRARKSNDVNKGTKNFVYDSPQTAKDYHAPEFPATSAPQSGKTLSPSINEPTQNGLSIAPPLQNSIARDFGTPVSQIGGIKRFETFPYHDPAVQSGWQLDTMNNLRTPISLDPFELNEARLQCREAMTLIAEEAYNLIYHPNLAYADFDEKTRTTRMKRPIYAYPEILKARLPDYIRNDAAADGFSRDACVMKLRQFVNDDDLWSNLIGDAQNPKRHYKPFVSLERNETTGLTNHLIGLSIHGYSHKLRYILSGFSSEFERAIGGIGFRFANDTGAISEDGCTQWEGQAADFDDKDMYRFISLVNPLRKPEERPAVDKHRATFDTAGFPDKKARALQLDDDRSDTRSNKSVETKVNELRDITKVDIFYMPGSGRIAGLAFHDADGPTGLSWKQWDESKGRPYGMSQETQSPPNDGRKWKFIGLMGDWDSNLLGHNQVLARVSGIWRRM